jgi:hypothetical protein
VDAGTGLAGPPSADGLYVVADYANLGSFLADLANSTTTTAGSALVYDDGTDSHLFISDGVAGVGANDVLITLEGVTGLAHGFTIFSGDITEFV